MKNLAGHNISIFLFQFVLRKNAISFVLNESIAEDLYPEIEEQIQPLTQACSETLMRHRHLCHKEIIMDGNILVDNCFEVMLSAGLGKYFAEREKQNLFNDAHKIANLLMEVMDRRTRNLSWPQYVTPKIQRTQSTNKSLEALGRKRQQFPWDANEIYDLSRLNPDDLPKDVLVRKGYDHRGHCIAFEHKRLGDLGRIILTYIGKDKTLVEAELSKDNPDTLDEKQKVLEEIVSTVEFNLRTIVKDI